MISYKPMSDKPSVRSPWFWVPSLYFAQGIPYVAVMIVSVLMYKRLGVSNTDIALYTSWLNLPWVIKPFWSPFVDLLKTKRWWIVVMQILVGGHDAVIDRGRTCRSGVYDPDDVLFPGFIGCILVAGFQFRHT